MSTMDKLKDKLHIRRKSQSETDYQNEAEARASVDSELEAMTPAEREAYLKEFEEAEKTGEPKKGSLIDKLIARGNKKTEEEIERQAKERQAARAGKDGVIR
ncbi:hypothetical protein BU26DRAFT_599841 [Trematosphaeria pertusa]|uniref:Uncharacterized protein n=1 Tax=Trematosphaeria pertusa TaxID=390896 RepID=A0A6A6J432_9PLEO|nr:uncharacterized protein BU26DRAFT_599841 [Trematosphaeria pertusa]KAF2257328.1 hypothetical protein BU26DRAFT_599841 [Trematosphaeria pertusa]